MYTMIVSALFFLLISLAISPIVHAVEPVKPRSINPDAVSLPNGFKIEPIISNLSVPTIGVFDGNDLLIGESGWVNTAEPRVLRIKPSGEVETVAKKGLVGPVTGILIHDETIYISHKGKISVVEKGGVLKDIVTGLPSNGDHQNNNIVFGPDGKIYLGQGTTTNAGVAGEDSFYFGWLLEHPEASDVPCHDIQLIGTNFTTPNVLSNKKPQDEVITGAYRPFGTMTSPGEIIKGSTKCGGSILRFNPDGSQLEVYAWGMRNPFGLKFASDGKLWATYHGADVRGSRSIYNDPDYFVQVRQGAWYGWPDYFDGQSVTESKFKDPTRPQPEFLWQNHPALTKPDITVEPHSGINGFAFSPGEPFGFSGDAFVALYGTYSVATAGTDPRLPGFKVVRINPETKEITDFAANKIPGPAYLNLTGGLNRPSDVLFGPDQSMYIVDWGASTIGTQGFKYVPGSGVVWRVYKDSTMDPLKPNGPLEVDPAPVPESEQKAEFRNVWEFYKSLLGPSAILGGIPLVVLILVIVGYLMWRKKKK